MNPLDQSHANHFNSTLAQSYPKIFPNMTTFDLQAILAKMTSATSSNSAVQLNPRLKEVDLQGSSIQDVLVQRTCSGSSSSEDQQAPQTVPTQFFPPVICNICGAFCKSKNGEPVCKSCRDFFRRSLRQNRIFKCQFSGTCEISHLSENCRACRMKKCREFRLVDNCRRPHDPVFKTPILKVQQATENDLFMKKISIISGSNPEIQFLNIKQVTASFIKDVLRWPKGIEMFDVLEEDQKLELVHSQWIRILIITICENGAHLLDLHEELSNIAHTFHQMFLNPQEIFWAKACLLFMMTTNEGKYAYLLDLNDALQNLHRETLAFDPSSVRFGVITMFLGSVAHLSMGAIQNMFESNVKKLLSLCL